MKSNRQGWWLGMARVCRNEFRIVRKDVGALIFFIGLPLLYPLVYTLIYNPEIVTEVPVAVVDNCRTKSSRDFVRELGATQAVDIYGYASNLNEAKEMMAENKVAAIIDIPSEYEKNIENGKQTVIPIYYDLQLLLKYRALLGSITDYQVDLTTRLTMEKIDNLGAESLAVTGMPVKSESNFLGDPEQGFASFVIPGILVLILQQSMILGITLLGGSGRERRRANGMLDPLMPQNVSASQLVIGKTLCYLTIYIPISFYALHFVPEMFSLPHYGSIWQYMMFIFPLLVASAMMGQAMVWFCRDRESSFLVVVFTSVLFLFLSGLTWPLYAITGFWRWLSDLVPATWGIQGFIRINSNNASLAENATQFMWLWILAAGYFLIAWGVTARLIRRRN